VKELNISLSWG